MGRLEGLTPGQQHAGFFVVVGMPVACGLGRRVLGEPALGWRTPLAMVTGGNLSAAARLGLATWNGPLKGQETMIAAPFAHAGRGLTVPLAGGPP